MDLLHPIRTAVGNVHMHIGEPAAFATRYIQFLVPMLPMMMLEAVGIGCLRGAGDMVTGLVTMILVNVVNITVAWSLLLGLGPLPQLGWDALPIGAACGHATAGLIPLAVLARGRAGLRIQRRMLVPDRSLMRRILRIQVHAGRRAVRAHVHVHAVRPRVETH